MTRVLVTGSIAYDYIMRFPDVFTNHILPDKLKILNVCFTVNQMNKHFGGTAGNIAYSLSLLKEEPVLFSSVGKDFAEYKDWLQKNGIPISDVTICDNEWTASAHIITDEKENQITGFYGGAMFQNDLSLLPVLERHDIAFAIIPADGKIGMLRHARELKEKKVPYICDLGHSIPSFNQQELITMMEQAYIFIVNNYEMELFLEKTQLTLQQLLQKVDYAIITKQKDGSTICSLQEEVKISAVKAKQVLDPTGAGDAYRAGLLKGLLHGIPIKQSAQLASVAGCYAVEHLGTQGFHYTTGEFAQRYRAAYGEDEYLNRIFANKS